MRWLKRSVGVGVAVLWVGLVLAGVWRAPRGVGDELLAAAVVVGLLIGVAGARAAHAVPGSEGALAMMWAAGGGLALLAAAGVGRPASGLFFPGDGELAWFERLRVELVEVAPVLALIVVLAVGLLLSARGLGCRWWAVGCYTSLTLPAAATFMALVWRLGVAIAVVAAVVVSTAVVLPLVVRGRWDGRATLPGLTALLLVLVVGAGAAQHQNLFVAVTSAAVIVLGSAVVAVRASRPGTARPAGVA